jgi:hypothetical protein
MFHRWRPHSSTSVRFARRGGPNLVETGPHFLLLWGQCFTGFSTGNIGSSRGILLLAIVFPQRTHDNRNKPTQKLPVQYMYLVYSGRNHL